MTAVEYKEYTLLCNHPGGCDRQFGPSGNQLPRARMRKLAARAGWVHVHQAGLPRSQDEDFCPVHAPETEEKP